MGEINLPRSQQDALNEVDSSALDKAIDECIADESAAALQRFRLTSCGEYVVNHLRVFERAVSTHCEAKSAKKRAQTEYDLRSAGDDLAHAVWQMKHRAETEEKEGHLFYVDDQILSPYHFSERLNVRVGYRWRRAITDGWEHGSITFTHNSDAHPSYTMPTFKLKPSAKQDQDRQKKLGAEWLYLKKLGLQAVRDYFREGREGAAIPSTFQAKADRGLNNYSAEFWVVQS